MIRELTWTERQRSMASRTTWYILAPMFAISTVLFVVGLGGAWYVHQANRDVSDALDSHLEASLAAERLVLAVREMRLGLSGFVTTSDPGQWISAKSWLPAIDNELDRLHRPVTGGVDESMAFGESWRTAVEEISGEPNIAKQQQLVRELIPLINRELLDPAQTMLEIRQQMASAASRENRVLADRIGIGLLVLGVCGALAGLISGFAIARGIQRRLLEINVPVHDMAGRLNEVVGPIKVISNSNLAELDGVLRVLADKTSDVVKRLQASQQATLRHEQLAAVGQLAAGLAHELRNPLMSVKLIVQTAAERSGESLNSRDLAVLESEIVRLEKMLQSFLDFARPPKPAIEAIDVVPLIESTLDVVRARAAQQDVQLHWSAPADDLQIEADPAQLRQVFLNLVLNALDALPGGGNVWVSAVRESPGNRRMTAGGKYRLGEAGGSRLVVRVADDGPGIAADLAERIFDPFVSTRDTGIGLGLSICRRIAESHNGFIRVANRHQGGAEFTMVLPGILAGRATLLSQPVPAGSP